MNAKDSVTLSTHSNTDIKTEWVTSWDLLHSHTQTHPKRNIQTPIFSWGIKRSNQMSQEKNILAVFIIQNEMLYMCFHALQSNSFKAFSSVIAILIVVVST